MADIIAKLNDGKKVKLYSKFNIGDYVKVVHTGHQYASYTKAFKFFWGNTKRYYLPYGTNYEVKKDKIQTPWKIINMVVHDLFEDTILYHIRSIDGKNCVVSEGAIKLIDFHHRNREPIGKLMIYQLPFSVTPHKWTEKLYKIIK